MNKLHSYFLSLKTSDPYFNVSYILMMLMMALLPFTTFFMWPIGVLLMLIWAFQGNWREKWENFKTNDGIPYGFFLLGICLIPLLGFINSENMPIAWRTFECYIWFFFTPFIFLTTSAELWSKRHISTLLILFSVSEVALLLFFFIRGILKTIEAGNAGFMFSDIYCYDYHHAYVALYATFVYILVFYYLIVNSHCISIKRKAFLYATALFIAVSILFLYSRAGILIFLFMHVVWSVYAICRKPTRWKPIVGVLILVFTLFSVLISKSPTNRFTEHDISIQEKDDETTDPRLIIWQAAWDGAVENLPWGVGTGDGNEVITEKYHKNGHWTNEDHSYNAHNQFLSALLTNGFLGLIILLLYFYAPFGLAIKSRDILLFTLFLLMILNCLVECMFDRRAGVDFFAIMIPLFIVKAHSFQNRQNSLS